VPISSRPSIRSATSRLPKGGFKSMRRTHRDEKGHHRFEAVAIVSGSLWFSVGH
jgi:hypothetical protein